MNYYTDEVGTKFYCLDPIDCNKNYYSSFECMDETIQYLSCLEDETINLLHREGGPAEEWINGSKFWIYNGKTRRLDGPAEEWSSGYKEWFYHGEKIFCKDNEEFLKIIKMKVFL